MKAIRYKNRAELFVLNGNKRPIRYEFHNGMKPNWYNGNMVIETSHLIYCTKSFDWFQYEIQHWAKIG